MGEYKYYAKICSDGRLYNGCMALSKIIPNPLPVNTVVLENVPSDICDGHNYIWDGETLTYDPVSREDADT